MKKIIFINHRIAQARPRGPVIVVETIKGQVEGNRVDIVDKGKVIASVVFNALGDKSKTHRVRAWVETTKQVLVTR